MSPATFFGALGPKPLKVAYVDPVRRPADGRYGENPNRLFHYFQYQVILKPSPINIQEIYLESLETDENLDSSSINIAWQLRQRKKKYQHLSEFAAGQVIEAIRRFEGHEDPSGTYGRGLTRICAILDLDLGDLIEARGSVEEMLRMIRAKVK